MLSPACSALDVISFCCPNSPRPHGPWPRPSPGQASQDSSGCRPRATVWATCVKCSSTRLQIEQVPEGEGDTGRVRRRTKAICLDCRTNFVVAAITGDCNECVCVCSSTCVCVPCDSTSVLILRHCMNFTAGTAETSTPLLHIVSFLNGRKPPSSRRPLSSSPFLFFSLPAPPRAARCLCALACS